MKKFLLLALVTLTSLTMSAQIDTKQKQHRQPQSTMVRPTEKEVAMSTNPVSRQLSVAKMAKLQPITGMPLRRNAKKALSTAGLKATKKLASAPRKAAKLKDKYTGSGLDYSYDSATETSTRTPVEWTMTPITLSKSGSTEVPGFLDIVPEPEMFKGIAGFEDGIPLETTINGNTITVAPQVIATGTNEQTGKFYVWVFGYTNDGSITMTLGEDGSLKTPANLEVVIGALSTDKFALNNNTFLFYYQWTENVKYTFEGQQPAVSPFLESYNGSGYDYFQETNVTWTMTPDADNEQFKCFVPAPASLAKYFPEGVDVPYAISGNTVTVAPFYTGLGYTEDDGTRAYLTLFGTADEKTFGDITLTLNDDKSLDVTPGTAVYLGVFLGTEFDPTMKTYDGGYQIIEEVKFEGEQPDVEQTIDGVHYTLHPSTRTATINLVDGLSSDLVVPEKVSYGGEDYTVTVIGKEALASPSGFNLSVTLPATITSVAAGVFDKAMTSAIVWNSTTPLPDNPLSTIDPSFVNVLLYVKQSGIAPAGLDNVVVNGKAQRIILQEGKVFHCPQEFTATHIEFSHEFTMNTVVGKKQGWETIALPFDVQTITHATNGHIVPFASYTTSSSDKPFWLYKWSSSGFVKANKMEANTPYLISMPNNTTYSPTYNLNGIVTFSADNATVRSTTNADISSAKYNDKYLFAEYYFNGGKDFFAINSSNKLHGNGTTYSPGSKFVKTDFLGRDIYPFEGLMIDVSALAREVIDIEFGDDAEADAIEDVMVGKSGNIPSHGVYTLSGLRLKEAEQLTEAELREQLPAGVYIVNGRKVVVGR